MTCVLMDGPLYKRGSMDQYGHRSYDIGWLVNHSVRDGPANCMQTPGLPLPGSIWNFDDDIDIYTYCTWEKTVKEAPPQGDGEPITYSVVNQKFSTYPPGRAKPGMNHGNPEDNKRQACRDFRFEDPLTEPQKLGGSFVPMTVEATKDRFGNKLMFPTFEQIRGPQAEFDDSRFSVRVEQNVALLQLNLVAALRDHVNAFPMWGLNPRCVKFKNFTWDRRYYGSCYLYYVRTMDFDINLDKWDRDVQNDTTKCLRGRYLPGCGSGARIQVLAVDTVDDRVNSITDARVTSGGSNYPKNAHIPLALTTLNSGSSTSGKQAVVVGVTDGSGVVTGLAPNDPNGNSQKILYGGELYSTTNDIDCKTGSKVSWAIRPMANIFGIVLVLPDRKNPSHFNAYVDDTGQPARCIVNKAGVPVTADELDVDPTCVTTHIEYYNEADLLLLGVPPVLEM